MYNFLIVTFYRLEILSEKLFDSPQNDATKFSRLCSFTGVLLSP